MACKVPIGHIIYEERELYPTTGLVHDIELLSNISDKVGTQTLTVAGQPAYDSGGGLILNNSRYVTWLESSNHSASEVYTASMWIKPTARCTYPFFISSEVNGNWTTQYYVNSDGTFGYIIGVCGNASSTRRINSTSTSYALNQWHHVVITSTGGVIKLYINATNVGSLTAASTAATGDKRTTIGARLQPNGTVYNYSNNASIKYFKWYNRVLSDDEIYKLFQNGR